MTFQSTPVSSEKKAALRVADTERQHQRGPAEGSRGAR